MNKLQIVLEMLEEVDFDIKKNSPPPTNPLQPPPSAPKPPPSPPPAPKPPPPAPKSLGPLSTDLIEGGLLTEPGGGSQMFTRKPGF